MSVVYSGLGIYLILSGPVYIFTPFQQYGVGTILLLYGVFRFYKAYRRRKDELDNREDEE
jgi:uncharacterized membrane protein HdeD (DUF308 family)